MSRTRRGWQELEPLADRTRLHFGSSAATVVGLYAPVVEVALAAGEAIRFPPECLLWAEPKVGVGSASDPVGWRTNAGLPAPYGVARGPGRLGLSRDSAGEVLPHLLDPGQGLVVRPGHIVMATAGVGYGQLRMSTLSLSRAAPSIAPDARHPEVDSDYPMGEVQEHLATTDSVAGLVLLYARGNAFVRSLPAGEEVLVRCDSVVGFDDTVHAEVNLHAPEGLEGGGLLMCLLAGPGRVVMQSQSRTGSEVVSTAYVAPSRVSVAGVDPDADPPWMRPGGPDLSGLGGPHTG